MKVTDKAITMTNKASGEINVPYGMVVWSTGIGTRPIILDFMKQVGQVDWSRLKFLIFFVNLVCATYMDWYF